jgi:hypothetical protein
MAGASRPPGRALASAGFGANGLAAALCCGRGKALPFLIRPIIGTTSRISFETDDSPPESR